MSAILPKGIMLIENALIAIEAIMEEEPASGSSDWAHIQFVLSVAADEVQRILEERRREAI